MPNEIALWPDGAPGSEGWTQSERVVITPEQEVRIVNVTAPTLVPFLPDEAASNGTAVIVAPGGGFRMLSMDNEGTCVAEWLRDRGVAAYVLKYRLLDTGTTDEELISSFAPFFATGADRRITAEEMGGAVRPMAQADGEQAMRHVRATGADVVGFMGFSAGGIVTCDVGLSDDASARPDFIAPIYGAASKNPLPNDAPPFFSVVCSDDDLCVNWCIDAYKVWREARRPAELHVYAEGGHGFGARKRGLPVDGWLDRMGDWMAANGWIGS